MIEIDEKTVDEMVDEIFGEGPQTVREAETPSAGGAQVPKATAGAEPSRRVYELICKDCGAKFGSAGPAARYCPACRKKRTSPPANDRQMKTENSAEQKGTEKVEIKENTVAQAAEKLWDALGEAETKANTPEAPPQERAPEDMTAGELVDALAAGMRREPGDVVLALYQAARDVARSAGIQTRILLETMYEIDCTLAHVRSV